MQITQEMQHSVRNTLSKHRLNHDTFVCQCGEWKHYPKEINGRPLDPVVLHISHLTGRIVADLSMIQSGGRP
jgi:hypothetical protein